MSKSTVKKIFPTVNCLFSRIHERENSVSRNRFANSRALASHFERILKKKIFKHKLKNNQPILSSNLIACYFLLCNINMQTDRLLFNNHSIAQLVEHLTLDPEVLSSNPTGGNYQQKNKISFLLMRIRFIYKFHALCNPSQGRMDN